MTSIAVSTGGFTPEIWSEKLNIALDNHGVYTDIVNRDYQGEIKNKGDKVYFYTLGNLTVRDYAPTATGFSGLTFEDPAGDKQYLTVDQQKYVAYTVDEIEKVQANIDLVNKHIERMAVAFSQTKDLFLYGLATTNATTKRNSDSALSISKDNIWGEICAMYAVLARKNAIVDGKDYRGKRPSLIITPEVEGIVKQCAQFFANAVGAEVLRKGQIGTLGGFDVFVDTNMATVKAGTGTAATYSQTIVAMTSDAITYAEQITETDIIKAENSFHHKVKALQVYGGKVANPDCIVTSKVANSDLIHG